VIIIGRRVSSVEVIYICVSVAIFCCWAFLLTLVITQTFISPYDIIWLYFSISYPHHSCGIETRLEIPSIVRRLLALVWFWEM
jgi:hypothetical protein